MSFSETVHHHRVPARRTRRAAVLAGAVLVAASLVGGGQMPAVADDGGNTFYKSEEDVIHLLEETSPLNEKEAVKGYPQGQLAETVRLEDVEKVYSPQDAFKDVKDKLGDRFDFTPNVDIVESPDVRKSSQDTTDPWTGLTAEQGCTMPSENKGAEGPPCGFVGVLEKKYPSQLATSEITGKAKRTYKVQTTVGQDKTDTKGWSVGGKVSASLKPPGESGGVEPGAEVNFSYSESTATTNKWTSMAEDDIEIDIPDGAVGWLDARANGGVYIGYIVTKELLASADGQQKQKIVAVPARVLVQAPGKASAITWVKRDSRK